MAERPGDPGAITLDAGGDSTLSSFTMYTTPWCGYCHRLQSQLAREGISYDIVDIEQVPDAAFVVEEVNGGNQTVPTLVYADGSAQTNPSVAQVKAKLAALN
jgi:mycoredoxin